MSDRRQEPRRKLMAFTPVYDLHPRVLLGYLGDLTLRGLLVIGTNPVTINKETTLEIIFPGELFDQPILPVKIPARIAWCRPDESPQYYDIGVQFTKVTPEQEELFLRLLERYHFRHAVEDADIGPLHVGGQYPSQISDLVPVLLWEKEFTGNQEYDKKIHGRMVSPISQEHCWRWMTVITAATAAADLHSIIEIA